MKRTPMKRTAFKSKRQVHEPRVEREPRPLAKLTRRPDYSASSKVVALPKRQYIRSKALLAAVRQLPCQITGVPGLTEPAHSNWPQHGKGRGIKADDNRVAAICHDLHRELDQGSRFSAEERQRIWWEAHCRTVRALLAAGTWPAGVPVPQIEDFWKP